MPTINQSQYRIFVCTKHRSPDHPEGCCTHAGAEGIYSALQTEIANQGLTQQVQLRRSGCLDRCAHGPVVLVIPPKSSSWHDRLVRFLIGLLPTKVQVKLQQWLFPQRVTYGQLSSADIPQLVQQQIAQGSPLKALQI
jgi:(2Fe-2S) ferredoxin